MDEQIIMAAVRECLTVVEPGETLIVRAHESWTPEQIRQLAERIREARLGFPVAVIPAAGFAVAQPEPDEAFADRVWRVMPEIRRREERASTVEDT